MRITKEEKSIISKLAKSFNISVSEYLKLKVFEHNSDHLKGNAKFITPDQSTHSYFLALSQVKLMYAVEKLFEKQGLMKKEEFRAFEEESSKICGHRLDILGYKKVEKA
jgi:5-methylcytosine-specific restriction endonuclease McrBC regulatory subunit McrC